MIDADELLAARLQAEEQEQFSIKEKSRMLVEMIAERKKVSSFVPMDSEVVKSSETRTEESSKRAGDELESDKSKKHKIDEHVKAKKYDEQEETEMKKHIEIVKDDEVAIDSISLATKPPVIIEYKVDKDGRMGYFKLIRADGSSKRLVPSCFVIYDLELLSLSFDFVFSSEIFKSLSFCLDRLCRLAILYLD
ncbi:hypothetical protein Tco_0290775 [Tanacetum coccineum]